MVLTGKYMKRIIISVLSACLVFPVLATHNRAGEITLKQISDYTYKIEIATFTYTLSQADRNQLEVQWGDNTVSIAPRVQKVTLPNFYYHNTYEVLHTYPGPGTYTIVVQDPNRNYGVQNIPNSVNVIFSIKTTITINPSIGRNSTPVLLNFPIDKAALGHIFIHNPAAYDPDGDSLSYELTTCTGENGLPINGYTLPRASHRLFIDSISGDLTWDTPVDTGIYNIAIKIVEWRKGVRIGSINRDMQIQVYKTSNNPPENAPFRNFCVEAGDTVIYDVISLDPDSDKIIQTATGGPFEQSISPPTFELLTGGYGYSVSRFEWRTDCEHVRLYPYAVVIKTEDKNPDISLVDIDNFFIKVIGPAPEGLQANPTSNSIRLNWHACNCPNVTGYEIYRREGRSDYESDSCQTGVPSSSGFVKIGETDGQNDTLFIDNNNGNGLSQGIEYCYRVVGLYSGTIPGYASEEVCAILIPGTPAMINVSVTQSSSDGSIFLAWAKPQGLEEVGATGPYEYLIYRYDDLWGTNLIGQESFKTSDLNDTTYIDSPLNTLNYPYSYKIELYNDDPPDNRFLIGSQEVVSSTYLEITPTDNRNTIHIRKNVPWINTDYVIYRQRTNSTEFDSIGITYNETYVDSGLMNGKEYCYQVKSNGWRPIEGIRYTSINFSHIACATPLDKTPPCPPVLYVTSFCDSLYNELKWTIQDPVCAEDVFNYRIYYAPDLSGNLTLIHTQSSDSTMYFHYPPESLAGCYAVTAVDSFENESEFSEIVCVDNCTAYELPNVFTPNGDGDNDFWRPTSNAFVEKVDMKVYSRWGILVFKTDDPNINWDGKQMNSNNIVSPGVYYYIADVYENRLTGLEVRNIVGFVYVFTNSDAKNSPVNQ
jgi:gliding motility-associated-like protein